MSTFDKHKKILNSSRLSSLIQHRTWFAIVFLPFLFFFILNFLFPLPVEQLRVPQATVVYDSDGEILRAFLAPDEMWRLPTNSSDISPNLKRAVLTFEDRYFYWHFGVNPMAVLRAALVNLQAGKVVQGGSTITMQVTRLMRPKERTLSNKIVEGFRAFQLEWRFSKHEILELYLNMAPYGGNLVGLGAASRFYFGKPAGQISLGEAALLAAIPNSPNNYRPDLSPGGARQMRRRVLDILLARGEISTIEHAEALSEPLPKARFELPFSAPHLAVQLQQKYPTAAELHTTIDSRLQTLAQEILRRQLQPLRSRDVSNGAVVIIENQTQAVRALVGSFDFFDTVNQGQVNGATAPRSPGSALKPFIYALAMQHGLISPQSLVHDLPVAYAGYEPVNYDGAYNGAVSAEEALVRSLNVPAVNLYAQLGSDGLYTFLQEAGISTLKKSKGHYGLSLALGSGEVTLLELTNLYAGLANGGVFKPLRFLESEVTVEGKRLLDPGTCFVLTEMLAKLRRPELPAVWDATVDLPTVAWKTGTSYGHRDAWSIGYTPEYTIGVWVGNFNAKGATEIVGADAAAPILFAIFEALQKQTGSHWFVQPATVAERQVCALSGMALGKYCATATSELYLPGKSPTRECDVHRLIQVDSKTGKRLCSACRAGRTVEEKVYEQWPADVATWYARNGYPIKPIPAHFPGCSSLVGGSGPAIKSPLPDAEYKIRSGVDLKYQKIRLDAAVSNDSRNIFWFVDDRLIFNGDPNAEVFLTPEPGAHTLMCMDDEGRSTEIRVVIR